MRKQLGSDTRKKERRRRTLKSAVVFLRTHLDSSKSSKKSYCTGSDTNCNSHITLNLAIFFKTARIRAFKSRQESEKPIHPFISSRLNLNSLFSGLSKKPLRLQPILTKTKKTEHALRSSGSSVLTVPTNKAKHGEAEFSHAAYK